MGSVLRRIATMPASALRCRKVRIAAVVVVALLLVQVVTYAFLSSDIMPSTGIRQLADYKLLETVEWILVEPEILNALTEAQRADLEAEIRRHTDTIYYSIDHVPDSAKHFQAITDRDRQRYERYRKEPWAHAPTVAQMKKEIDEGRHIIGFKKGIRIFWKLDDRGLFWMKCSAGHYVASEGAEHRSDLYVWAIFRWLRVRKLSHEMA